MTSDLKKVGLIFNADGTVDFKKSLSSVNGALQENRNQFKLTKAQWDENTKASEKLKATQEYLSKQYEESSKKVSVLRSELSELENAENRDENAIQKKKNALIAAETTMTKYKAGLSDVNTKLKAGTADIDEYAKKLQKMSDKAVSAGKTLSTHVTAPIIAVGTAAIAAWMKVDEAYDNIVLKTGATGEALDSLTNSFDNVYGSMPVDSMQVSEAIGEVNTRFKVTGDELENLTTYMLEFAEITGKDVTESVAEAQRLQGNYNLSLEETKNVMGLVAKNSQDTGISVDKLMDLVNKNSSVFKEMDLNVYEAVNLLSDFEAAGLDSDQMLVGLKKAASNYSKEGKSMSAGLTDLIERLQNSSTEADATTEVFDIFGAKAGLAFKTAAQEGRINIGDLSNLMSDYSNVVSDTYNATLDPADKAKIAMNNLTLASAELGDILQTALGPILQWASELFKSLASWLKGLDETTKTVIVTVAGVVAAIGPLLILVGTLAGSVSKIMLLYSSFAKASAGLSTATGVLGGSFSSLLAPIAAVIAIIALIVAAFVQLWNTNEEFGKSVESAIASVQKVFQELWDVVLGPIFQIIKDTLLDIWENGIKPLWDNWVSFVGDITIQMLSLWEAVQPIVMWFIDTFGPVLVNIFNYVSSMFSNAVNTILNVAGSLLSSIGDIINGIIKVFKGIITFITGVFTGDWSKAWSGIVDIFGGIFDAIVGIAKAPINLVIGLINGMVGSIESGVNFVIDAVNSLSFKVPKWIPGIGGKKFGFDLDPVSLGRLTYLAKGGDLLNGSAIVGEAGMELLTQKGNRTTVSPLTRGGGANPVDIIDYNKLAAAFIKAIQHLRLNIDNRSLGEIVDERILKAVM